VVAPPDLAELSRTIALADLYISGSTGPLHIAGALDRPTAAFYPGHRSGCALRWQTLNSAEHRLAFSPPAGGDPTDVSRTDVAAAAREISVRFLR
jgi:ADP-heptose:LPS heptosyltransferase